MSTYYPDFPSTNFPDDVDSLWNLNDINSSTYEDALKYQQYISSGNLSAASDLLSKNTALQKTIINADKINMINQQILALQTYAKSLKQQITFSDTQPSITGTDRQLNGGIWAKFEVDEDGNIIVKPYVRDNDEYKELKLDESTLKGMYAASDSYGGSAISAQKLDKEVTIDGSSFNGTKSIHHYGICYTDASTPIKEVEIDGVESSIGSRVIVNFANGNTADSPKLSVNGETALEILYDGDLLSADQLSGVMEFVSDSRNWRVIGTLPKQEPEAKILWRGGLFPSGSTGEFAVAQEYFHNNNTTLTLVIESYLKSTADEAWTGNSAIMVSLSLGDPSDFGINETEQEFYPYEDNEYAKANIYREVSERDTYVSNYLKMEIKVKKVVDGRYAICEAKVGTNSSEGIIVTCISAYVPKD